MSSNSIIFIRNKQHTWEDMKAAYERVYDSFRVSSTARDLRLMLDPLANRIDRIVIVGLGSPSDAMHNPRIFQQLAMVDYARRYLNWKNDDFIEMYNSDFGCDEIDKDFLFQELAVYDVDYKPADEIEADKPDFFTVAVEGKRYTLNSFVDKSGVNAISRFVTSSSILFMPFLPIDTALKLLRTEDVHPLIVITHGLDAMWDTLIVKMEYTEGENAAAFKQHWEGNYAAWQHLRDDFARSPILLEADWYWVYVENVRAGDVIGDGWVSGEYGLVLDREAAIDLFLSNNTDDEE
ncbi:uncharacterized protein PV09_04039 [Verruconis gallopava]|uniref:SRR1-like domain-containing protein n=1 Tax=Verruconis gallopava TaxID=253628 RepID=A0A0D1YVY6_9PEZI|nr:uncharacterized protein PV09_04039 [Verruconis gallopava]KIW04857.1 hypothetical protein PV09_04039 [Verruconis gallopava]